MVGNILLQLLILNVINLIFIIYKENHEGDYVLKLFIGPYIKQMIMTQIAEVCIPNLYLISLPSKAMEIKVVGLWAQNWLIKIVVFWA